MGATTSTVSFANQKLVEMSYFTHNFWKNRTEADLEYLHFLLEVSAGVRSIDIPQRLEATYTKCHG